jgi:hypothetical protein
MQSHHKCKYLPGVDVCMQSYHKCKYLGVEVCKVAISVSICQVLTYVCKAAISVSICQVLTYSFVIFDTTASCEIRNGLLGGQSHLWRDYLLFSSLLSSVSLKEFVKCIL